MLRRGSRRCRQIWSQAMISSRADPTQTAARLLLPALNEMIDVTTSRTVALHTHLPLLIFALLISVALRFRRRGPEESFPAAVLDLDRQPCLGNICKP